MFELAATISLILSAIISTSFLLTIFNDIFGIVDQIRRYRLDKHYYHLVFNKNTSTNLFLAMCEMLSTNSGYIDCKTWQFVVTRDANGGNKYLFIPAVGNIIKLKFGPKLGFLLPKTEEVKLEILVEIVGNGTHNTDLNSFKLYFHNKQAAAMFMDRALKDYMHDINYKCLPFYYEDKS